MCIVGLTFAIGQFALLLASYCNHLQYVEVVLLTVLLSASKPELRADEEHVRQLTVISKIKSRQLQDLCTCMQQK